MRDFNHTGTAKTVGELMDILKKLNREHKISNCAAVGTWSENGFVESVSVFEAHNLE